MLNNYKNDNTEHSSDENKLGTVLLKNYIGTVYSKFEWADL